jgi:hypothetical protein
MRCAVTSGIKAATAAKSIRVIVENNTAFRKLLSVVSDRGFLKEF